MPEPSCQAQNKALPIPMVHGIDISVENVCSHPDVLPGGWQGINTATRIMIM